MGCLEGSVANIIQCPATAFGKLRQYQFVFVGLNHFSHPATSSHALGDGVVAHLGIAGSDCSVIAFNITRLLHASHHGGGKGKVLACQDIIGIHLNNHKSASISTTCARRGRLVVHIYSRNLSLVAFYPVLVSLNGLFETML